LARARRRRAWPAARGIARCRSPPERKAPTTPTPPADDWRRQGQEIDLKGCAFAWRRYAAPSPQWDHDHCEFCWSKFMVGPNAPTDALAEGYRAQAADSRRWVCRQRFEDFKDEPAFTVRPAE